MNNYNHPPQPSHLPQLSRYERVKLDGVEHVYDSESQISVPLDLDNPLHKALLENDAEPILQYPEQFEPSKRNRRTYTLGSKAVIGTFVAGRFLTPFAYKAGERLTHEAMNAINPFEDKVLEQTTVWEDALSMFNNPTENNE